MPGSIRTLDIIYVGTLPPHRDGGAIVGAGLLTGLARRGHSVRALSPITAEAFEATDPSLDRGVEVTRFLVPYDEIEPNAPSSDDYRHLQGKRISGELPSLIAQRRPDVVVAGRETFAWHVPDICSAHALPCALILHGTTTAGILSGTYPRAEELLEQYTKADLIVVPAEHMARLLEGTAHSRVKVIPNSVDLRLFHPRPKPAALGRKLGIPDDDVVVAHVSNLKRVKRPLDVVGSAVRALAESDRLTYLIVGDGPCRAAMETACAEAGASERFRFTGWVDHDRVPDYVNLADVVVMPSEFEAQAGAYLETQACGRVLLASDVAGAREVIVDGETGLLHRVGDIDDLASKTLELASDDSMRAQIGRRARQAAMAHSDDERVAAYAAAFADLATKARR